MDVRVVLGFTAHEWGSRLVDWIADHADHMAVRERYALESADVLTLDYDCLVLDHETGMLTTQLVARLHRDHRVVVGVHDPAQPASRERLVRLGVDTTVPCDAEPHVFVERIMSVTRARPRRQLDDAVDGLDLGQRAGHDGSNGARTPPAQTRSRVVVVTGAGGGVGATELAVELAACLRRRDQSVVLVDADLVAPSLAHRLYVPMEDIRSSNLLTAIDAVHRGSGALSACVTRTAAGCALVCGLERPGSWENVTPEEVAGVVSKLSTRFAFTIVQTAAAIEQLPSGRHGVGRRMLEIADRAFIVADASPLGIQRLTRWMWLASALLEPTVVHVVCNHSSPSTRADIEREVMRTLVRATVDHLPEDGRVRAAGWALDLVAAGPYTRAVAALLDARFPETCADRPRRFARRGR